MPARRRRRPPALAAGLAALAFAVSFAIDRVQRQTNEPGTVRVTADSLPGSEVCVRLFGFLTAGAVKRADIGRDLAAAICDVGSLPGRRPEEVAVARSSTNAADMMAEAPVSAGVDGRFWIPANLFAPTASDARSENPGVAFRAARLRAGSATRWLTSFSPDTVGQFPSDERWLEYTSDEPWTWDADVLLTVDHQPAATSLAAVSMGVPLSLLASGAISVRDLRGLYLALGVLQAFDIYSTRAALAAGAREANPLMTGVPENIPAFVAVKAASTAATIALVETARKRNPVAAMATIAAINSAYVLIAVNNWRVVGVANDRRRM